MNKDQFKLQVYNNRYVRGVVVTICKIIIWTLIYVLIASIVMSVVSQELASAPSYYSSSPALGAGAVFALLILLVVTIAYYWAVIAEIVRKIKQNKQLTEYENDYLESGKAKE